MEKYFKSSFDMLSKAFPEGVQTSDYIPLLSLLYEEFSNENLTLLISDFCAIDKGIVYNDILKAGSEKQSNIQSQEKLKTILKKYGYNEWLNEQ